MKPHPKPSSRRHVILFQERFTDQIIHGTKVSTIRAGRKRAIQSGDTLDLRMWTGAPYRSPQLALVEAKCLCVMRFELLSSIHREGDPRRFFQGYVWTSTGVRIIKDPAEWTDLATHEGFSDGDDMISWFDRTHDIPFVGQLIAWGPISIRGRCLF